MNTLVVFFIGALFMYLLVGIIVCIISIIKERDFIAKKIKGGKILDIVKIIAHMFHIIVRAIPYMLKVVWKE